MRPLRQVPTSLVILLLLFAMLGFADAGYLTAEHYMNAIPPCSIGSCEFVLTSAYSTILGIPVAVLGLVYYLCVLIGIASYLEGKHEKMLRFSLLLTFIGFLMSLWFLSVQALILHSYCLYCLGSATISTILFITAVATFKKYAEPAELS